MNRHERRSKNTASGRPDQALAALLQQAQTLLQQRKREEAAEIYLRILKSAPANPVALFNLGKIYHEQRNLDRAAYCFGQALRHNPGEPQFSIALAFVKADQQDMDAALGIWESVKDKASSPQLLVKLGTHLRILGRLEEARNFFEEALATDPLHLPAYQGLSLVSKLGPDAPEVLCMLDIEKKGAALPPKDQSTLGFILGNVFLDAGDGDNAFPRLAEANKLRRAAYKKYDISLIERYADNIISVFGEKYARKCEGMGREESKRPVFITGMPRSGSTLTEQILSAHPDAASLGETDAFTHAVPVFPNAELPGLFPGNVPSLTAPLLDALSPGMLDDIASTYLAVTREATGKAGRAIDKMLFNFMWTGLMAAALPKSSIIHCTRNPLDTCLSIWRLAFLQDIPWAYDMQEIGRFHRMHDKLSQHWEAIFPGKIHETNYENMVAEQEKATRALLAHCDMPWDDKCLAFHENAGRVHTASATQVRQPIYKSSAGKWQAHEKHLAPLIKALEGAA